MRNLRGTYVHRGDGVRRRTRFKRTLLFTGFCTASYLAWDAKTPQAANAEPAMFASRDEFKQMQRDLDVTRGKLDLANAQLERWNRIYALSSRYGVGADLAASIYDISQAEGIDAELGFRLVRVESQFNEHATSPVGAVGLTQVMLPTARYFDKGLTREKLYDRDTNLRIGFRYLRGLIREYKGNVKLALLVYNRGPVAVEAQRANGIDPSNGYDRWVTKGYLGKGVID
jgi:soluble lytic murein transglycosylase-like protein